VSTALVLSALLTTLPTSTGIIDAPDKLITAHGVEIRSDERVFVLFAALNGLGFSEETQRKGPPLRAPVYHTLRVSVRDALRKADTDGHMGGIRAMFDANPAEIETYLEAILSESPQNLSPEAKKLVEPLAALEAFRQKADLVKLFDSIAVEQRNLSKDLKARLEKDFGEAQKQLGNKELRSPTSVVVVPNPLDGHDSVRVVRTKDKTYIIAGPGLAAAQKSILEGALRRHVEAAVDQVWNTPSGSKYAKHWDTLKGTSRITRYWPEGKSYLADTLARTLTFKIQAKLAGTSAKKDAEDDFVQDLNKADLRWAPFVMRALDGFDGSEPIETALPKLLAKSYP
jgi:hypothetical protein